MPTILFIDGYRFFFYSNEGDEPIHINVEKAENSGKIWLEPSVNIVYMHGFTNKEIKKIEQIIKDNLVTLVKKWDEYFGQ